MKKPIKLLGIIALAAVIGFLFAACDDGGDPGGGIEKPSAPTGVTATALSASRIRISWNSVSGARGYRVYYSYTGSTDPSSYRSVPSGNTSHIQASFSPERTYYFKVSAYNSAGEGPASRIVSATTPR